MMLYCKIYLLNFYKVKKFKLSKVSNFFILVINRKLGFNTLSYSLKFPDSYNIFVKNYFNLFDLILQYKMFFINKKYYF